MPAAANRPVNSHVDKVSVFSLDVLPDPVQFVAQFNPTQLQIDEGSSWSPNSNSRGDNPHLEYTKSQPRTLAIELLFDSVEDGGDVKRDYVDKLSRLRRVIKADATDEGEKRPPMVELRWGTGLPPFRGVIESLSTKFTMFRPDGTPVRATCSVKLIEAAMVSFRAQAT